MKTVSTREQVLVLLEKSRGKVISGEEIAQRLNLSRNAVWKTINRLKEEGHKIEAVSNKGYSLNSNSDVISTAGIRPFLRTVASIEVHKKVVSTNTMAKERAALGAEHGTVIIAEEQSAGRGRHGRSFFSPAGHGIYMSLILKPEKMGFGNPALVTIYTAVAGCEAIEHICKKSPQIKWVNDLFIDQKKICGISAETVMDLESQTMQWIVVGIGVNFTLPTELPAELEQVVGAVYQSQGDVLPGVIRNHLAAEIVNRMLSPYYNQAETIEKYRQRLFILGKKIRVEGTTTPYEAIAIDIDDMGHLLVEDEAGERHLLSAGEISVRF